MLGTFAPDKEPYMHTLEEETTSSGLLARGIYASKLKGNLVLRWTTFVIFYQYGEKCIVQRQNRAHLLLHMGRRASFVTFAFGAARLPNDEVQSLKDIAKTLGKTDWDFSGDADPCSGQLPWTNTSAPKGREYAISCNCSYENSTVCHITSM